MGLILLIAPLIIYYAIIVPMIKIQLINRKITNKKLKNLAFVFLLLIPVGDHIIGYGVYKVLCYTNGEVKIYKTVTDEQEQRDYWFYDGLNVFDNSYDDKEYKYLAENKLVKRGICTDLLKDGNVGNRVCAKGGFKEVYLNYCNDKYNTLSKTDPNYKKSCTNADEIIKKYNLKNVIKVPESPYSFYSSALDKTFNHKLSLLYIGKSEQRIKNESTNELLAEYKGFSFWGGWYINLVNIFHPTALSRCGKKDSKDLYGFKEVVIPNSYKNNQGK